GGRRGAGRAWVRGGRALVGTRGRELPGVGGGHVRQARAGPRPVLRQPPGRRAGARGRLCPVAARHRGVRGRGVSAELVPHTVGPLPSTAAPAGGRHDVDIDLAEWLLEYRSDNTRLTS